MFSCKKRSAVSVAEMDILVADPLLCEHPSPCLSFQADSYGVRMNEMWNLRRT
jgi:hypothetical protein